MLTVILAAGQGKRMGEWTRDRPKPLLLVRCKPIIEHILTGIRSAGIDRGIIVVGYLGDQIVNALGDGSRFGLTLQYVWQREARGTAEALLLVQALVNGPFLLSWGDVLVSPENYRSLLKSFTGKPAAAWIGVNEVDDPSAGAAVYVGPDGRVDRIIEKPAPGSSTTRWNNAGIGVYAPRIFEYAAITPVSARGERELPEALDLMVRAGELVYALPIKGFWSDVGTPDSLARAERDFPSGLE